MVKFGFCTHESYLRAGERRRQSGAHAAYSLLDLGENPSEEMIRAFEHLSFTMRTSKGTYRTTLRERLQDVDAALGGVWA
jgi:hypothetical protein